MGAQQEAARLYKTEMNNFDQKHSWSYLKKETIYRKQKEHGRAEWDCEPIQEGKYFSCTKNIIGNVFRAGEVLPTRKIGVGSTSPARSYTDLSILHERDDRSYTRKEVRTAT